MEPTTADEEYLIPITRGLFAAVDKEDYEALSKYSWNAQRAYKCFYAAGWVGGKVQLMHRVIMTPPAGQMVDHINRNTLDNRKSNLRICSCSQNMFNSKGKGAWLKGVGTAARNKSKPWRAQIMLNYKQKFLGYFETEELAHAAYCDAAKKLFGEFFRAS